MSLGGYTVALLAGMEPGLDGVVAGIPVADFPGLFHAHSPRHIRVRAIEHRIMGGTAENVYRVVSPLCFDPLVAPDRRYIFAGYGDRLATPDQARRLAEHWGDPVGVVVRGQPRGLHVVGPGDRVRRGVAGRGGRRSGSPLDEAA